KTDLSIAGDLNGDGRTDIAVPPASGSGSTAWTLCLSTGTGFSCSTWTGRSLSQSNQISNYLVGDFNADGIDDVVGADTWSGPDFICLSNGTSFQNNCSNYSGAGLFLLDARTDWDIKWRMVMSGGDFLGNGRPAYAVLGGFSGQPGTWRISTANETSIIDPTFYSPSQIW